MYLNYSISKLFLLLIKNIFHYKIYIFIVISALILMLILLFNKKLAKYIILGIDIILSFIIVIKYGSNLLRISNLKYFYHNMYFYFFNSIIFMIINLIMILKNKLFRLNIIFFSISFIFLTFCLFMTYYLYNTHILLLGNIYSEYVIGNYLYFIYYIIVFINIFLTKRKQV